MNTKPSKRFLITSKRLLLLVMMLTAMASKGWAGGSTYQFKATATASPTGAGKVYVSFSSTTPGDSSYGESSSATGTATASGSAASTSVYLYAQPESGYMFSHWSYYDSGSGTVNNSSQNATITVTSTSTDSSSPQTYNFTAHFIKEGDLKVKSSDATLGSVSISNGANTIGDEVTITANPERVFGRFIGWQKEGSDELIKANPYTLTVEESVTYTAMFEAYSDEGFYCLIQNKGTGGGYQYLGLIGTANASITSSARALLSSLACFTEAQMHVSPATVIKMKGTMGSDGGLTSCVLESQGKKTSDIVMGTSSTKANFTLNKYEDNGYLIYGIVSSTYGYMCGNDYMSSSTTPNWGATKHPAMYNRSETYAAHLWRVWPLTEEDMDTHYVGVVPSAANTMAIDGENYYMTTFYAAFPFKCYDGMRAYYVYEVEGNKAYLKEITSGEVPSNTAVILACKGTTAKENRYLPVNVVSGTLEDNLLKGVIDVSNNNNKTESNYRTAFNSETMRVLGTSGAMLGVANPETMGTAEDPANKYLQTNTAYLDITGLAGVAEELELVIPEPEPDPVYMVQSGESTSMYATDGATADDLEVVMQETEAEGLYEVLHYRSNGHDMMDDVATIIAQMKEFAQSIFGVDADAADAFIEAFPHQVWMQKTDDTHYYSFVTVPSSIAPLRQFMKDRGIEPWNDVLKSWLADGGDTRENECAVVQYIVNGVKKHLGEAFIQDRYAVQLLTAYTPVLDGFQLGQSYYINLGTYDSASDEVVVDDSRQTLVVGEPVDGMFHVFNRQSSRYVVAQDAATLVLADDQQADEVPGAFLSIDMEPTPKVGIYQVNAYESMGQDLVKFFADICDQMKEFAQGYFGVSAEAASAFIDAFDSHLYMQKEGDYWRTFVQAPSHLEPLFDLCNNNEVAVNETVKGYLDSHDTRGLFEYIKNGVVANLGGRFLGGDAATFARLFGSYISTMELGERYYVADLAGQLGLETSDLLTDASLWRLEEAEANFVYVRQSTDNKSMYTDVTAEERTSDDIAMVLEATEDAGVFVVKHYVSQGHDVITETIGSVLDDMKAFAASYFSIDNAAADAFVEGFLHDVYLKKIDDTHYYTYVEAPESLKPIWDWYADLKAAGKAPVIGNESLKKFLDEPYSKDNEIPLTAYILNGVVKHFDSLFGGEAQAFLNTYKAMLEDFDMGQAYYANLGVWSESDGIFVVDDREAGGSHTAILGDAIDDYCQMVSIVDGTKYMQVTYEGLDAKAASDQDKNAGTFFRVTMKPTAKVAVYEVQTYRSQGEDLVELFAEICRQMSEFAQVYFGISEAVATDFIAAFDSRIYMKKVDETKADSEAAWQLFVKTPNNLEPLFALYNDNEVTVNETVKAYLEAHDTRGIFEYIKEGVRVNLGGRFLEGQAAAFVSLFADKMDDIELGERYYMVPTADGSLSLATDAEVLSMGNQAGWTLELADETNAFRVAPHNLLKGSDGLYYTTVYTDFAYQILDASQVQKVVVFNEINDEVTKAIRTELSADKVPARQAVMLGCTTPDAANNLLMPVKDDVDASAYGQNLLKGVCLGNTVENDQTTMRVLSWTEVNGLGFYKYASKYPYMGANKAWLDISSTGGGAKISFIGVEDGGTSAIVSPDAEALQGARAYDLSGRQVPDSRLMKKGVYVVNGRKVVVK